MREEIPSGGPREEEIPEGSGDVPARLKQLQEEILSALVQRVVPTAHIGEVGEDASDEELEESEQELNETMKELGLSWDDLKEMGIKEITITTVREDSGGVLGGEEGKEYDPVLEEKVKEYYHLESSRDVRLFLLNLYSDELGEDLWCLETFPAEEMYRQGMERLQEGGFCTAYVLFSFASLKGCEEAGPALMGTAEVIHMNDRAYGTHHFNEVKAKVERAVHFARKLS